MPDDAVAAVLYEVRDEAGIAVITINRPQARNAINRAVRDGMFAALERFEADPAAQVAILTGAGDRAFCAGMDLKEAASESRGVLPRGFLPMIGDTIQLSKPTIAAVNGFAMAGGWMFAQMCDLCVAAEHASFAITEAKVGRGTPWAAPLMAMLPQRVAMEILLTGEPVPAATALRLGLVNRVVPQHELLPAAFELAETICANAPLSTRAIKEAAYRGISVPLEEGLRIEAFLSRIIRTTDDSREGPRAFAEKRPAAFKGR
jgi:enoyl-CoA hydratase/carnithine racemase